MDRCPNCPNAYRCVPGDGPEPSPSRVLFIGGMPGDEEDRPNRPMFTGRSGREFNETYLRLAGLSRDEIRITNSLKCRNESGKQPEPEAVRACADFHLPGEIECAEPEFIVLMGAAACSLIPDINLDTEHGIPRYNESLYGWTGTVIPMDHPSKGMRDTSAMIPLLEDFSRLRDILAGTYVKPENKILACYQYVTTAQEVHDSLPASFNIDSNTGKMEKPELAIDMEDHDGVPFSIQWSSEPGRAYMLLLSDSQIQSATNRLQGVSRTTTIEAFQQCLDYFYPNTIFHNSPGDIEDLRKVGITINPQTFRDTMQEAYHLGNLPQGLKALAYRLLGVRMRSWAEVVGPPSRKAVLDWIEAALAYAQANLSIVKREQLKTKIRETIKPSPLEKRLKGIFRYTCFSDDYPVWKHLTELAEKEPEAFTAVVSTHGPVPKLGIGNCTPEEALEYACKDADMTLRVARVLESLRSIPSQSIYKGDYDKIAVWDGESAPALKPKGKKK